MTDKPYSADKIAAAANADWKAHAAPLNPSAPVSDPQDKTCAITVHNVLGWELDSGMLQAVLAKCAQHLPQATMIDVYPQERVPADAPAWKHPGWCEWIIRIHYRSGSQLTIGAIQRTVGAQYEFHS